MPDVIHLLRDLIALPSVNPSDGPPDDQQFGESRVVDALAAFLRSHGIDCVLQEVLPGRCNLLARVDGRSPEAVILEAHTDTVSVEGMQIPPFDPRAENGRIYGRGACDDKASLAAMAQALVDVAYDGVPERTCILAATCDEEYRFSGILAFVSDPGVIGLSHQALSGAWGCVGEPTGLDVVVAHKGAFRWRVRTRGRAAHSSEPQRGENAIYRMTSLLAAMQRYAADLERRPQHPLVGGPTFSVGVIRGGSAVNVVPDRCEVLVDRRLIPGEDGAAAEAELRQYLGGDVDYSLENLLTDWPLETAPDAAIVQRVQAAALQVLGRVNIRGVAYGTDASKLDRAGVQCVVCGPGDIAQAHQAVEWVEARQVEQAVALYRKVLTG